MVKFAACLLTSGESDVYRIVCCYFLLGGGALYRFVWRLRMCTCGRFIWRYACDAPSVRHFAVTELEEGDILVCVYRRACASCLRACCLVWLYEDSSRTHSSEMSFLWRGVRRAVCFHGFSSKLRATGNCESLDQTRTWRVLKLL